VRLIHIARDVKMGAVRVVLDTDVIVAAMRSPAGASSALLQAALDGRATLLANVALALEYEAVCSRAEHRAAAGLTVQQLGIFVDAVLALIEPVESHFVWRPQLRDPADEMVLEAAVNGGAQAIVSFNQRDYAAAPVRFGIRVLLPRDALRSLSK
jgi:putative PIN family toxin of toxin-antitoxin system